MAMNVEVEPDWGEPPGDDPAASTAASDHGGGRWDLPGRSPARRLERRD
ncbi:hypothetical protein I552_5719 [Mycobacterium xenopi 3993]|nr:hypothetical protein I552_5719 [Mycobacterium xenopi 3993]